MWQKLKAEQTVADLLRLSCRVGALFLVAVEKPAAPLIAAEVDAAEENVAANEAAQASQPGVDELVAQVKALTEERDKAVAESRKWEGRSKSNAAAAKRLAELEDASKTDAEKLADAQKRAEEAEGLSRTVERLGPGWSSRFYLRFLCNSTALSMLFGTFFD